MSNDRYTFRAMQRVKSQPDFQRITRKGVKLVRGPLIFNATLSRSPKTRIGIRISRRCGNAVVRNQIKRLLRESYRLMQHDWPFAANVIITVKPHTPLMLPAYQKLLSGAMVQLVGSLRSTSE